MLVKYKRRVFTGKITGNGNNSGRFLVLEVKGG